MKNQQEQVLGKVKVKWKIDKKKVMGKFNFKRKINKKVMGKFNIKRKINNNVMGKLK